MDQPRIDAIATRWSLIRRPEPGQNSESTTEARRLLVLRYAAAIRRYLDDDDLRARLRDAAPGSVERFSRAPIYDRLERILLDAAG